MKRIFLIGFIYLFFSWSPLIAVIAIIVIYLLEMIIDNTFARVKWPLALKSSARNRGCRTAEPCSPLILLQECT